MDIPEEFLLQSFNKRDTRAFGTIYRMLYRELFLYASRLFEPLNLSAEDFIQDIFIDLWKRHSLQFTSLAFIKNFCLVALKNAYKNEIKHLGHKQRFELANKAEDECADAMVHLEQYKTLYDSLQILPKDYATVIRMYLEGWKPEEIASKLNIALQTVYNKRREAIIILRKYMMIFFSFVMQDL